MKNYLNSSEIKEMVVLVETMNISKKFIESGILTTTETGDMKRGRTFISKSFKAMLARLDSGQAKKFSKAFDGSKVAVMTNSELEVLSKRKSAELDAAYEDNKEYFNLVEITMDMSCKNCSKCGESCELRIHFEDQFIPELDGRQNNCKYSYKKD